MSAFLLCVNGICHMLCTLKYYFPVLVIICSQSESLRRQSRFLSSKTFSSLDMVKYYYLFNHCFDWRGLDVSSDYVTVCFYRNINVSLWLPFLHLSASLHRCVSLHLLRSGAVMKLLPWVLLNYSCMLQSVRSQTDSCNFPPLSANGF